MPVPLLRQAIRCRHSVVDEERGGRVIARHIFNANETGFPMAPWPTKVLAGKGDLHVTSNTMALNIPPFTVYPGCNFHQTFLKNSIPIFHRLCSGTQQMGGWMPIYLKNGLKSCSSPRWKKLPYQNPYFLSLMGRNVTSHSQYWNFVMRIILFSTHCY